MIQLDTFQTICNGFKDILKKKIHKICQLGFKKEPSMLPVAPIILNVSSNKMSNVCMRHWI